MMSKKSIVGLAVVCLVGGISHTGQAVVLTGTPEDSWTYAMLSPAGQSITTTYFPTSRSDFAAAVVQGYATYDTEYPSFFTGSALDTMHVFTTFLYTPTDMSIALRMNGDDGHSLFVDDAFVGGGGFGVMVNYTLSLQGGVVRKLELVGYNAGGPSVFGIGLPDNSHPSGFASPINGVAGLSLNADADFSPVPEPTTLAIWGTLGTLGLIAARRKRTA
jgi:hypothetical protein